MDVTNCLELIESGLSVDEIVVCLNTTHRWVCEVYNIHQKCHPNVQKAWKKGLIGLHAARMLSVLNEYTQLEMLERAIQQCQGGF